MLSSDDDEDELGAELQATGRSLQGTEATLDAEGASPERPTKAPNRDFVSRSVESDVLRSSAHYAVHRLHKLLCIKMTTSSRLPLTVSVYRSGLFPARGSYSTQGTA